MTSDPKPDDATKDGGESTLLSVGDYVAKSLNGEINPDEWGEIDMSDPGPASTSSDDDDPGDGLSTGRWVEACAKGDRDWATPSQLETLNRGMTRPRHSQQDGIRPVPVPPAT